MILIVFMTLTGFTVSMGSIVSTGSAATGASPSAGRPVLARALPGVPQRVPGSAPRSVTAVLADAPSPSAQPVLEALAAVWVADLPRGQEALPAVAAAVLAGMGADTGKPGLARLNQAMSLAGWL